MSSEPRCGAPVFTGLRKRVEDLLAEYREKAEAAERDGQVRPDASNADQMANHAATMRKREAELVEALADDPGPVGAEAVEVFARIVTLSRNADPDDVLEEPYTPVWHDVAEQTRVALEAALRQDFGPLVDLLGDAATLATFPDMRRRRVDAAGGGS